jgi:hypothetical protein
VENVSDKVELFMDQRNETNEDWWSCDRIVKPRKINVIPTSCVMYCILRCFHIRTDMSEPSLFVLDNYMFVLTTKQFFRNYIGVAVC